MVVLPQRKLFLRCVILMLSLVFCVTIAMAGCSSLITTNSTSNSAVSTAVSTPTSISTVAVTNTPAVSPTTPAGSVILATGKFIDTHLADHGSGDVTISRGADGKYEVLLDHLNVSLGPQLHVYLAATASPTNSGQVVNGVDLGALTARQGSVRMGVPADAGEHLRRYQSVVIFCKQYLVIFTVAPLQFT